MNIKTIALCSLAAGLCIGVSPAATAQVPAGHRRPAGRLANGVPAEFVAQRGQYLHAEAIGLARPEPEAEGQHNDGRGHGVLDALLNCPSPLTGVLDVAHDVVEVRVLAKGV